MKALLALLAVTAAPGSHEFFHLGEALRHLAGGRVTEAYAILDSIPVEAREYPFAFAEMQKIHYRNGEWDKFFGFAVYYRKTLIQRHLDSDLVLLESLALTRHCQFEAAGAVASRARELATGGESRARAQVVEDLYYLQTKLPGNVNAAAVDVRAKAFSSTPHWKIPPAQRAEVIDRVVMNPRSLRVYVRNLCGGKPS